MQWYEQDENRWRTELRIGRQLLDEFESGVDERGNAFIQGVFHVRSEHNHRYESVKIRTEYPPSFPWGGVPPTIYLVSHRDRWKKGGDSHINLDWSLCLFVPGESGVDFRLNDSLERLFAIMHTFLFKQHLYQDALLRQELTGDLAIWPGKARSHGFAGIVEAVKDRGKVGRNETCPCGSGKKFKACCLPGIKRSSNGH
jgi:hypothetical protein